MYRFEHDGEKYELNVDWGQARRPYVASWQLWRVGDTSGDCLYGVLDAERKMLRQTKVKPPAGLIAAAQKMIPPPKSRRAA